RRSREATAWAGSDENGAIWAPVAPVVTAYVARASPTNMASRDGTWSAALPGECPGTAITRGDPGTSRVAPSPKVTTSWIGGVRNMPVRTPSHTNDTIAPLAGRPHSAP